MRSRNHMFNSCAVFFAIRAVNVAFSLSSVERAPAVALAAAVYELQLAGPLWAFWGVSAGCSAPWGLMCAATVALC